MHSRRTAWLVALVAALATPLPLAQSDDPFLRSLDTTQPVDRSGLAHFMVRTTNTLDAGRDAVAYMRLIAEDLVPGEQFKAKASAQMRERYDAYERALGDFRAASRRLLDDPRSDRRLFVALLAGQHACWRLESHINLAESYGANAGQLRGVLASGSVCSRFAHVAFQPKVSGLIEQALLDPRDEPTLSRENRVLREELAALQQLLEDLREIDAE